MLILYLLLQTTASSKLKSAKLLCYNCHFFSRSFSKFLQPLETKQLQPFTTSPLRSEPGTRLSLDTPRMLLRLGCFNPKISIAGQFDLVHLKKNLWHISLDVPQAIGWWSGSLHKTLPTDPRQTPLDFQAQCWAHGSPPTGNERPWMMLEHPKG